MDYMKKIETCHVNTCLLPVSSESEEMLERQTPKTYMEHKTLHFFFKLK